MGVFTRTLSRCRMAVASSSKGVGSASSPTVGLESGPAPFDDEATAIRQRERVRVNTPIEERGAISGGQPENDDLLIGDDGLPGRPARHFEPARETVYAPNRERNNNAALVIGLVALLVASGIAGWVLFGDKLFGGSSERDLIEAQQAITDSIARVESLPREHPLRVYLPQLLGWQGELRGYLQSQNLSPQALDTAARYRQKAEELAGQARAALVQVERGQNGNLNTAMPSPAPNSVVAPPLVEPVKPEEEEDAGDADPEPSEEKNENVNSNTKKKDRPEPPVPEPVKPPTPEPKPSNSNRPRNERPPNVERVNQGALQS